MAYWSRKKVVEELKEISQKINHSPSARQAGAILYQASRLYFGSFNKAKQAAGLEISLLKHHQIKKGAKTLNKDLVYILGVIKGDGYLSKMITPKRTSAKIGLDVKNIDFALEFKKRLEKWSGIQPKFWQKNGEFYVALYSIDAVNIVQEISLEQIANSNKKLKANFLRGLYDSEGGVLGKNLGIGKRRFACRWIHFSNSNKETITIVSRLLKDFGINHKIRSRIHSGFGSKKRQYEILIFSLENFERFLKNIGFSIKYKKDKLLEVIRSYDKYRKRPTKSSCI